MLTVGLHFRRRASAPPRNRCISLSLSNESAARLSREVARGGAPNTTTWRAGNGSANGRPHVISDTHGERRIQYSSPIQAFPKALDQYRIRQEPCAPPLPARCAAADPSSYPRRPFRFGLLSLKRRPLVNDPRLAWHSGHLRSHSRHRHGCTGRPSRRDRNSSCTCTSCRLRIHTHHSRCDRGGDRVPIYVADNLSIGLSVSIRTSRP